MSRSYRKPVIKSGKAIEKEDYHRKIRRVNKNIVNRIKDDLELEDSIYKEQELINDYDYCDYIGRLHTSTKPDRFTEDEWKELVTKLERK